MMFDSIETALKDLKAGKPIIVVDNEDRENEGDLVAITDTLTIKTINFMITHAKGLVCAPISYEMNERLKLSRMTSQSSDPNETAFTVSIDHISSTTGISVKERFETIKALADEASDLYHFTQPGHIFPLVARKHGVQERMGHTEACVDLAKCIGATPAGVICEIINEDGTMARRDDLFIYKKKHGLSMITIEALLEYIRKTTKLVNLEAKVKMPTRYGEFDLYGFKENINQKEHLVYYKPYVGIPAVRIHSECMTGDVFHSQRCDCGEQLEAALTYINEHGGLLIYLRQEGRGIGLINKLKAYEEIEKGLDTVEANLKLGFKADERNYAVAASMLKELNIDEIDLITNNPMKLSGVQDYGIKVRQRIPHQFISNKNNERYLKTKKIKLGHLLEEQLI